MPPRFPIDNGDMAAADGLLRKIGVPSDVHPIAIHAGSARTILAQAKRWPTANYAQLITRIQNELALRPLLLEGPDEAGVADEIISQIQGVPPPVLRLSGSLGATAAILKTCAAYCGSDSGLAHLSAAVGTRAVTLFAPADPDRVCPYGCRDMVVQPRRRTCSPCFLYPWDSARPKMKCTPPFCINDIHIDDVIAALNRALQTPFATPGIPAGSLQ
jgi:ADP-heptose:LPS heptosyltransferase